MGRRATKVTAILVLAFTIAGVSEGCRTATQVELDVTYDGMCSDLQEVAFIIGTDPTVAEARIESNVFTTTTSHCAPGSPSRVGSLVVTPNDATGRASIIVLASFGGQHVTECKPEKGYAGCIIARRAFAFVEHTALTLEIPLEVSCKNVPCDAVSTCKHASCVTSTVACSGSGCGELGVLADGGTEFVDAPMDPDAFVQRLDAQPPDDGSITDAQLPPTDSASPDAQTGVDAASCVGSDEPVSCTTAMNGVQVCSSAGAPVCCSGGATMTIDGGGPSGYACHASGDCFASMSNPTITCRSAANCPQGSVCCINYFAGTASCTAAGSKCFDAGMGAQACVNTCECQSGEVCMPGPTPGTMPQQAQLSVCQPKPASP